jgi:hypothetical protein
MVRPMQGPMRCGAKTRRGTPCQSPAVRGKRRCRMHGGAPGSGAPFGRPTHHWHAVPTCAITGMPASFPQQRCAALRRKSIRSRLRQGRCRDFVCPLSR